MKSPKAKATLKGDFYMSLFTKKEKVSNMEATANNLGSVISDLRKKNNLTQEDFASALGVTAQAVSKWENNVSCPDIMLLPKIAEILGVSIDELMGVKPIEEKKAEEPQIVSPVLTDAELAKLKLRVLVIDNNMPDKKPINISVPVSFVLKATSLGLKISGVLGNNILDDSQLGKIVDIIKSGVTGEILRVETDDNKTVVIEVV